MITTGIIREINITESNSALKNNKYIVEIPIFNTPSNTNGDGCKVICNASVPGGLYASFDVGDMVYVSFVNNNLQYPVIIGKIYKGSTDETRSYANLNSLTVISKTQLSKDTYIGDISYDNIKKSLSDIDTLKNKIATLEEEVKELKNSNSLLQRLLEESK